MPHAVIRVACDSTGWRILQHPSHGLFVLPNTEQAACGAFTASQDRRSFVAQGFNDISNDNVGIIIAQQIAARGGVYVFRAERLNLGQSAISEDPVLAPNAANLASVLLLLMSNPNRYQRLMECVRLIFPTIYEVRARPRGNQAEIQIWQVDPATERDDLAITLNDSGTGVGQVLAILYVVIASNTGRTIVIDEPNSFLHPGASRKLMQILRSFDQNQYIISTHSPEVINVTEPSTVHLRADPESCDSR
jgi:predicted ATPase